MRTLRCEGRPLGPWADWPWVKKGPDSSLDALLRALDDEDEEVRENSAWALGELAGVGIGTEDAIPKLNRLLG